MITVDRVEGGWLLRTDDGRVAIAATPSAVARRVRELIERIDGDVDDLPDVDEAGES